MRRLFVSALRQSPNGPRATVSQRTAFTLIELLVVVVILSVLASLSLAALAGARQRAKVDKTKSTIRKLHEIIVPQFETYLSRRTPATAIPAQRLQNIRKILTAEMPDQWADVNAAGTPAWAVTAPVRRYSSFKILLQSGPRWATNGEQFYESAECLAMIVMRGGFDQNATEWFRADEVADVDDDGAPEFIDGWAKPIRFIRWPGGFTLPSGTDSPMQSRDSVANPDPFDPNNNSTLVAYPNPSVPQRDFGLVPLIYSAGPDAASQSDLSTSAQPYGIQESAGALSNGWLNSGIDFLTTRISAAGTALAGSVTDAAAAQDNITNHDLVTQ